MDTKVNDIDLKKAIEEYFNDRDKNKFTGICGTWAVNFAKRRFQLTEDELSELFLLFYEKSEHCIDVYVKGRYRNFPSFFTVYIKHMVLNLLRKKRTDYSENYLSLWDEERLTKDTEFLIHDENSLRVLDNFSGLQSISRLLLALRFNMEIGEDDLSTLKRILKKQNKSFPEFQENYKNKVFMKRTKRNEILQKMTTCNRRLYKQETIKNYKAVQGRKKKLLVKLDKTHRILSLREIAETLAISRYKAMRMYKRSVMKIKNDFPAGYRMAA